MRKPFFLTSFVYSHNMVLHFFVLRLMHLSSLDSLWHVALLLLFDVSLPLFFVFLSRTFQMLPDVAVALVSFGWHIHYNSLYILLCFHPLSPISPYITDQEMFDHVKQLLLLLKICVTHFLTKRFVHDLNE